MSFWNVFVGVLTGGASTAVEAGAGAVSSEVTGITDTGAALGAFFKQLTDVYMWRSLAWLILGLILFGLGLVLLLRKPIEREVGTIAKAVAL